MHAAHGVIHTVMHTVVVAIPAVHERIVGVGVVVVVDGHVVIALLLCLFLLMKISINKVPSSATIVVAISFSSVFNNTINIIFN